jgi:hypothetical protein
MFKSSQRHPVPLPLTLSQRVEFVLQNLAPAKQSRFRSKYNEAAGGDVALFVCHRAFSRLPIRFILLRCA